MNLAVELARTSEGAKAGPIGLAVILLLCIACYFLFKSMSKHMRRVREDFPVDPPPAGKASSATPTPATSPTPAAPPTTVPPGGTDET